MKARALVSPPAKRLWSVTGGGFLPVGGRPRHDLLFYSARSMTATLSHSVGSRLVKPGLALDATLNRCQGSDSHYGPLVKCAHENR